MPKIISKLTLVKLYVCELKRIKGELISLALNRLDKTDSYLRFAAKSDISKEILDILIAGKKISQININIEQPGIIAQTTFFTKELTLKRIQEMITFANTFPLNFNEFLDRTFKGE